jgi:hypothetical protein
VTVRGVSLLPLFPPVRKASSLRQEKTDTVRGTFQACIGKGIPGKGMGWTGAPCSIIPSSPHSSANRADKRQAVSGKREGPSAQNSYT